MIGEPEFVLDRFEFFLDEQKLSFGDNGLSIGVMSFGPWSYRWSLMEAWTWTHSLICLLLLFLFVAGSGRKQVCGNSSPSISAGVGWPGSFLLQCGLSIMGMF